MNKKETLAQVKKLLSEGTSKSEVFDRFSGQGVSDRTLAYAVATYIAPSRLKENKGWVKGLLVITYIQLIFSFIFGFSLGLESSLKTGLFIGFFVAAILALFAWGFHKNKLAAYNVYILLAISQSGNLIKGFSEDPIPTIIAAGINIAVVVYVCVVKYKLFPDFNFLSVNKVKGAYVFTN